MKLWLEYFRILFLRKKKIFLSGFFSLLILLGAIYFIVNHFSKPALSEGVVGTYEEKDMPEVATTLLSSSLVTLDKSGLPHGNMAESWQANDQASVYTFKLKKDLKWSDGTVIKASDLSFDIPDVEVKYPDDQTLEFKLTDSFSPFPTLLTKPVFKKGTFIGTGPYTLTQLKKDNLFVKKITLTTKEADLPKVVINFYPNEKIAKNALKIGEVQSLLGLNEIGDLNKEKNLNTWSKVNYKQLITIFYNTKDPILSDDNFRLGLSFAAPTIKGEAEAKTSLPPDSWAFNNTVKDYLDNLEQAKTSLNKVKNGKDSTIILTATSSLQNVGQRIVDAWKNVGVKAVLRVESGIPQNFQALLITESIPADPDQYALWHSTQTQTNISKYSSQRIDKDLEDGRKLTDINTRKERYQDFQKVLLDHAPATFMYFPKYNVVYLKKVQPEIDKILNLQIK